MRNRITPKNFTATFTHRYNSHGYRTYWQENRANFVIFVLGQRHETEKIHFKIKLNNCKPHQIMKLTENQNVEIPVTSHCVLQFYSLPPFSLRNKTFPTSPHLSLPHTGSRSTFPLGLIIHAHPIIQRYTAQLLTPSLNKQ
jgi:hypothetical protein